VATAPLIHRELSDPFAYITQTLPTLQGHKGIINVALFLSHVKKLSELLPAHQYVINLCGNRYLFAVGLCAALLKQQTNLLPPNKNALTQQSLLERYPDCYVLSDGIQLELDVPIKLTQFDLTQVVLDQTVQSKLEIPQIDFQFLAVVAFTSGSTGSAQPNLKSWQTLYTSTQINCRHMLQGLEHKKQTHYQLATVPSQHMWGFETSVLLPLFANVCMTDVSPLFPKSIETLLTELPEPRLLVSAPVHLRALHLSQLDLPKTARVLCATAPLSDTLAQAVEHDLQSSLLEVYGCSEVGSMACRATAKQTVWRLFDGIEFQQDTHKATTVSTEHLPIEVKMQDVIQLHDNGRSFELLGRSADMIEIAGKRGSLQEMNTLLMQVSGLIDGVVFFPEQNKAVPRLVAIVVLGQDSDKQAITGLFKRHLDNVFVPRPIIQVDVLPRQANGKLPKRSLQQIYQAYLKKC